MKQILFFLSILLITISMIFFSCANSPATDHSNTSVSNSKVEATLDSSGEVFSDLLIAFESGSNTLGDTDSPRSMSTTKGAFFPEDIFDPDTKTPVDYLVTVLATDGEWRKVVNNAAYGAAGNTVDVWIGNYVNSLYNVKFVEYFNSSPVVVKSVSIYKTASDSWEPLTDIDDKDSVDPAVILANYKSIQETVYYFDGREETRTIEYMPTILSTPKYYAYNTTMDNSEWSLTNAAAGDYSVKQSLVMDYPDWISELFMQVNNGVSYYTELAGESFTKEYWYENPDNGLDKIITANEYLISRTVGNTTTTKNKIDIYAFKWGSHGDNVATIDENITITTTGDNLNYAGTSVTTIQSDVLSKLYLKSITKTINLTGDIGDKTFTGTVAVVKEHKTGTENYTYTLTTGSDGNGRYIATSISDLPVYYAWEKKLVNSTVQFKFYFETKQLTGSITLENGNSVTIDGTLYRGKFIGDVDVVSSGKGYSGKVLINKFFIQANIASANYNCIPGQDDF